MINSRVVEPPLKRDIVANYCKNVKNPSYEEFHSIHPEVSKRTFDRTMESLHIHVPTEIVLGLPCIPIKIGKHNIKIIRAHIVSVESPNNEEFNPNKFYIITMSNGVKYHLTPKAFADIEGNV